MAFQDQLLNRLSQVFTERTSLCEPYFQGKEKEYLNECIETGWVSTGGPFVQKFETALGEFLNSNAVSVSNGTSGLHLCYHISGIEPGDEVLVPALTFVATVNALKYTNAIPHFVDCESHQFGVDPEKLRTYLGEISKVEGGITKNKNTGRPLKALVVMHTFGLFSYIDELKKVCEDFNLLLIEDAAESLGSTLNEQHAGTFGHIAALSFNGNKVMTTGGGGAVVTNDPKLSERVRHLVNQAKIPHPWEFIHDEIGFNYRMPNLNAALGLAQIECLPQFLEKKRQLHIYYQDLIGDMDGAELVNEREGSKSNYWLNAIVLNRSNIQERNNILNACVEKNIHLRPVWKLMHKLDMYQDCPRMDLSCAEDLENRILNLPSSVFLVDNFK